MEETDPQFEQFDTEFKALLKKYDYVLSAVPFIDGEGRTLARPVAMKAPKKETIEA